MSYVPRGLDKYLGVSTVVSLLALSLPCALCAFISHRQTERRLAAERIALDAKYEAKMQELIQQATAKHKTTN